MEHRWRNLQLRVSIEFLIKFYDAIIIWSIKRTFIYNMNHDSEKQQIKIEPIPALMIKVYMKTGKWYTLSRSPTEMLSYSSGIKKNTLLNQKFWCTHKLCVAILSWNSFFRSKSTKIMNFRKLKECFVQFSSAVQWRPFRGSKGHLGSF